MGITKVSILASEIDHALMSELTMRDDVLEKMSCKLQLWPIITNRNKQKKSLGYS